MNGKALLEFLEVMDGLLSMASDETTEQGSVIAAWGRRLEVARLGDNVRQQQFCIPMTGQDLRCGQNTLSAL